MTKLVQLNNGTLPVKSEMTNNLRFVFIDNQVFFVLADILKEMQTTTPVTKARDTLESVFGKGVTTSQPLLTNGGMQELIVVSEPCLTYLVAQSKTKAGKELNLKIHTEILPSIKNTGKFELQKPKSTLEMFKLAVIELEKAELEIKTLNAELTYKNDIIHEIAEEVPAKTMRSTINQIIRNYSKDYQKNWTNLYKEFKYIYHRDLPILYENAIARCELGKSKNILDYAERFDYLLDLYKLAIKLFEDKPSYRLLA